jgi:hypothetical protein
LSYLFDSLPTSITVSLTYDTTDVLFMRLSS